MSLYSYATLSSIAKRIKSGQTPRDWVVVDVRDSDFIGGHIPGCIHIPSIQFDRSVPDLIQKIKDVKFVVFHCALSQQRGPHAAKLYAEKREEALLKGELKSILPFGIESRARQESQEIVILQGGFQAWVNQFRDDPDLIEGHRPGIW
ncbi:Rhodanese-like domain-containing protein [Phakopsora pachyrhizi]|uniref:Rhodanese-like domain-containing protein n=1 Tax=Phakopsora pachyrhizi TaxID=170000 RepID=A0AAV0BL56_PHAPC|nr:Rhodanese-like domain-containing protein [Phakopsora pachyrhizi]